MTNSLMNIFNELFIHIRLSYGVLSIWIVLYVKHGDLYEINWKITCYRDDCYFSCMHVRNMSRTQKTQQLAPLSVVQQAICLVVIPQPH